MRSNRPAQTLLLRLAGTPRLRDPFRAAPGTSMAGEGATLHVDAAPEPGCSTLRIEGDEPLTDPRLPEVLTRARELRYAGVHLAGEAALLAREGTARHLVAQGVTTFRCRMLSSNPVGYALLTGVAGAFQAVQLGLQRAFEAGLALEVEAVLLDPRVLDPEQAVLRLAGARDTARRPRSTHPTLSFVLSDTAAGLRGEHGLRPVPLGELARRIDAACGAAAGLGVDVRVPEYGGLPPCLFVAHPAAAARCSFRARRARPTRDGRTHGPACDGCAYRSACLGLSAAFADVRGTAELVPQARRLAGLTGKPRDQIARRWGEREVAAARESDLKVLRLTMACNQACVFCPSDDTSENIARDGAARLKRLARWRRSGVQRLSFSGGEPTLDPQLPALVEAASRLGFPNIEVVTNAVRLADPAYAQRLIDAGLTQATVSLHSHVAAESDALTCGRPGDFERTLQGLRHLLASRRLRVYLNHVIHAGNASTLPDFVRFVAASFSPPPIVTFAALTPLYRALERPELWPRLSELAAPLKAALDEGVALGLELEVLSRPGIPPCILAPEHVRFSDLAGVAAQAASEDAHKKVKRDTCAQCRFDAACGGIWKAYAERFGFDELVPVP